MRSLARSMSLFLLAAAGSAQCGAWDPGLGVPGVQGNVYSMVGWDPGGAGPTSPQIVLGGAFSSAGTLIVNGIVTFDPVAGTFAALGSGVVGAVRSLVPLPNGTLLVQGEFTAAGGLPANGAAVWDGTQWATLPFAIDKAYRWNGQAVLCGSTIDLWDGTTTTSLGSLAGSVYCVAGAPNGDLVVAGNFTAIGGVAANGLARWNGTQWTAIPSSFNTFPSAVVALGFLPNGDLVAGGGFNVASPNGQLRNIARWNGSTWLPFGTGASSIVRTIVEEANGDLLIGGEFLSVNGVPAPGIARWNGSVWAHVGGYVTGFVYSLLPWPGGDLYVGGILDAVGGQPARAFAKWTGTQWSVLPGIDDEVGVVLPLRDGRVLVGGLFDKFGQALARRVALWNGSAWQALGSGISSASPSGGTVNALAELPNGDLVVAGFFTTAGGTAALNIARWNGSAWSAMGSGLNGSVWCLVVLANGDLVAGGSFTSSGTMPATCVARWNGTAWSAMPGLYGSDVRCAAAMPNGDVVVTGTFGLLPPATEGRLARWNGSSWSWIPQFATQGFVDLIAMPNGDLVAAGPDQQISSTTYSGLARWNGVAWSSLTGQSSLHAYSAALHPDGRLVVAGWTGGTAPNALLRVAGGVISTLGVITGAPLRVCTTFDGDVILAGRFQYIDQFASPYYARYRSTCRPTATVSGAGCPHAGGVPTLSARELPWLGATYRIDGASLPATAIAVAVTGFGPASTPIAGVLQPSDPGCTLWVTPDLSAAALATGGAVTFATAVPNSPAIVGLSLHQQLLVLGLDAQLQLTDYSLSNALQLTVGTL